MCRCPTTSCSSSCSSQEHTLKMRGATRRFPRFFKASAVLLVAALIGVAANLSNLYHTYTYSKETMRGKSELVQTGDAAKANQQRTGPRLHHQLELWHRRNLDAPRSQLQRRFLLRPPQPERNRHGKGQPDVRESVQLIPAVLRQPALDRRPRLCGCIRPVPLRAGLLHRKRTAEMGVAGSNASSPSSWHGVRTSCR